MRILLLFLLLPFFGYTGDPIACGPETVKQVSAIVTSVRDGDWHTASTWSNNRVPAETDDITFSHNLTATKNIVIKGRLSANRGKITFLGINEANFVGSGMDVLDSDVGLWVMAPGQLNLTGVAKTSWTNLTGSALKGATSITITTQNGWVTGDEIVIATTDKPLNQIDWNDVTNQPIDPMIAKFERRIITAVSANTIHFTQPLLYDHLSVTSTLANRTWTPEVANLTRSIVIEGTKTGRSHIFIMSNRQQTVKFVEGRWLGPRTPGYRSGNLVNGRYGLHFHHNNEGSIGSEVTGNSFHDIGNRVYVPHVSDGISFKDNVAFDMMEQPQWWDFQSQSHSITFDHNLQMLRRYNGVNAGSVTGNELNQGDDNVMKNNVAVYIHHGDPHQQGAYSWNTNTVGVWTFVNNLSHSNITGLFVWQNDNGLHVNDRYVSYNDELAMHHGAYINEYSYVNCIAVNSIVSFEATQGNTNPMFTNYIIDGQGKLPYLVRVLSSPVPAGQPNVFVNPKFGGYTQYAIQINTELFTGEIGKKIIDVINPTAPDDRIIGFGSQSIYGSYGRVQRGATAYQISQVGRATIQPFATNVYGTGTGTVGKYYTNNTLAVTRLDPMIKFQQWSYDEGASPDCVHHSIPCSAPFNIVWDFYYEPQYTGQTTFSFQSWGGVRLTVDGRQILDRWVENDNGNKIDAPSVAMEIGKRYKLRVEHFDAAGNRGIQMYTKVGSTYYNVPISQLYPDTTPVTQPNRPPLVDAGPNRTIQLPDSLLKITGAASDPDGNLTDVAWSGPLPEYQKLSDAAEYLAVVRAPGTYTMKLTAKDAFGLTAIDSMIVTALPPIPPPIIIDTLIANAGPDRATTGAEVTLDGSQSKGANVVNWYKQSGPASWNLTNQNSLITKANRLTVGKYVFRLKIAGKNGKTSEDLVNVTVGAIPVSFTNTAQTGSSTCIDGTVLTYTVPAGKYTAITQATADALAIQELNENLAKCPLPDATFEYDGHTFYIFKQPDGKYKVIII